MIMHIPKTKYYHKWLIGATFVVPILPLAAQTPPNLVFIMADQYPVSYTHLTLPTT